MSIYYFVLSVTCYLIAQALDGIFTVRCVKKFGDIVEWNAFIRPFTKSGTAMFIYKLIFSVVTVGIAIASLKYSILWPTLFIGGLAVANFVGALTNIVKLREE